MNWKSTVLMSGPAVIATWLFSTPAVAPQSAPAPSPAASTRPAPVVSDIEQQAARLQARLHGDEDYHAPARNPFRFNVRAPRPVPVVQPVEPPPIVLPTAPPPPSIRLAGIASDGADATPQRTAILSTGSDVLLVKEGESAAGYRVKTIEDDAVELEGTDGAILKLTFRP